MLKAHVAQDLDSAHTVAAPPATSAAPVNIEDLAAENRRLKQALAARELQKKRKLVLKQTQLLKELQVQHALQVALAEREELKKVAKAVSYNCDASTDASGPSQTQHYI